MQHLRLLGLFLIILAFLITGCGSKDLTKGKSPQEIVLASGEAMQKIKSYAFNLDMDLTFPDPAGNSLQAVTVKGTGLNSVVPLKTHLNFQVKLGGLSLESELYAVAEGDKLVEYIKNPQNNEWLKIELPLDHKMKEMLNPANSLAVMKETLVNAKILGEEEDSNKNKLLLLEVTLKAENLGKFMQWPTNANLPMENLEKQLAAMGNITYNIWVRKDTLMATKMQMDLGQLLQSTIKAQPHLPPQVKEQIEKITATMRMNFSDFDKAVEINVPEQVKSQAKDLSPLLSPQMKG